MSDENDIILDDGESDIIGQQLDILNYVNEYDHSNLYDDWQEQKIKVVSNAMKIIIKQQQTILKGLK